MANFESDVLQLHRKELPLTDGYVTQLKSSIYELESEVDSLERQISVFEAICHNLHRTLAAPKRALALRRAVLAPIHKLPHELLVAVFQHCIRPDPNNPASLGLDVGWKLLRVCRSWRSVLEGTPALWTNLALSLDNRPRTQMLELYLSLSAQRPLWVTTYKDEEKELLNDNWWATFWKILSSTTHRWQRLHIRSECTRVGNILMHLLPLKFPMLEEVYLYVGPGDLGLEEPFGEGQTWFKDAPRLKRAMVSYIRDGWSHAWFPSTITHMYTEQDDGDKLECVFSFPDLQELTFEYESYYGPLARLKPIYHTKLKYLRCCDLNFRYLTLPALQYLTIEGYDSTMSNEDYHDTMSWADNVSALIHRSQCRLTDLHIFLPCTPGKEHAYTKLLALLAPTLVVLGLTPSRYSPDTDKLIRSLTRTKSSPGSLPHLEHLQLSPRYTHDEDPLRVDLLVDTIATTLMSLRDGDLAEQWHAPLLARVSVISRDDALIAKLRTSCLDFLLSQGLEVVYARDRGDGSDTLGAGWHGTWSDRFESNRETIVY